MLNISDVFFTLGDIYSNCSKAVADNQKAIFYYHKSRSIQKGFQTITYPVDGRISLVFKPNNYSRISPDKFDRIRRC